MKPRPFKTRQKGPSALPPPHVEKTKQEETNQRVQESGKALGRLPRQGNSIYQSSHHPSLEPSHLDPGHLIKLIQAAGARHGWALPTLAYKLDRHTQSDYLDCHIYLERGAIHHSPAAGSARPTLVPLEGNQVCPKFHQVMATHSVHQPLNTYLSQVPSQNLWKGRHLAGHITSATAVSRLLSSSCDPAL